VKINYNVWNEWTEKSSGVSFKSPDTNHIGDGEEKLGAEYGVKPLGQNSNYDLMINNTKIEVKKLDPDGSFRLGVDINEAYTPYLSKLIVFLEAFTLLKDSLVSVILKNDILNIIHSLNTPLPRNKYSGLVGLKRAELSESNLNNVEKCIGLINHIYALSTSLDNESIDLYSSIDGSKKTYNVSIAYQKILLENNLNITEIIKDVEKIDLINFKILCDNYKDILNISVKKELSKAIHNSFNDHNKILAIVDEKLGYKIIDNEQIVNNVECYRITSGSPRAKYFGN
jgi:hypothetical protein